MPAPSIVNPDRLISDICKALPLTFPVILRLVQYEYLIISDSRQAQRYLRCHKPSAESLFRKIAECSRMIFMTVREKKKICLSQFLGGDSRPRNRIGIHDSAVHDITAPFRPIFYHKTAPAVFSVTALYTNSSHRYTASLWLCRHIPSCPLPESPDGAGRSPLPPQSLP